MQKTTHFHDTISHDTIALPPRFGSFLITVIGIALLVLALLIWHERIFELSLTLMHNHIYLRNLNGLFQVITQFGISTILLMYCLLLLRSNPENRSVLYPIIICALLHFFLSGMITDIVKIFIDKPRPSEILVGLTELTTIPHTASFPSAHSAKSLALVLPFILFIKGKHASYILTTATAFLIALAVGYSRIALQKHFLSDVLAGFGTACITVPLSIMLLRILYTRYPKVPMFLSNTKRLILLLCVSAIIIVFASF